MDAMMASISTGLANGSWGLLLIMFGVGITMSLNPCMGAMVPLVLGGTHKIGYGRSLMFMAGFTGTLMILGLGASSLGMVLTLPGWFWISFIGLLYLSMGLWLLQIKLPISITGFHVSQNRRRRRNMSKNGLNPAAMGMLLGLAPSPCTMPVIIAVSALAMAKGKLLFGVLALGSFGLGHSILISLAFLPPVRELFKSTRFTRRLRPAFGVILILLSLYFFLGQPDIFNHETTTSIHIH